MEFWLTRDIEDGTSENEVNFIEETEAPHSQMQQHSEPERAGEDEDPNLMYKCRFCGQSFAKSYELGGHMNSHRREKEVENARQAHQLLEELGLCRPSFFPTPDFPSVNFISRAPSPVSSDITEMQTHAQSNFYHTPPLDWNVETSQNTGMPYEQHQIFTSDPANTSQFWPSLGAQGMQVNYLQQQDGDSTSVAAESNFSQDFQSPSSYSLQSEFAGQVSEELQQLSLSSSIPIPAEQAS